MSTQIQQRQRKPRLNTRQLRAIELMFEGKNDVEVCKLVRVNVSTLWKWRKNPVFTEKFESVQSSVIEGVIGRIRAVALVAIDKIEEILTSDETTPSIKLNAAKAVLGLAMQSRELEIGDLLERLKDPIQCH